MNAASVDSPTPQHALDPRRVLIDFLPLERRLVRREGVVLHGIAYWSDVLSTWIGERHKMIVRYDPRDLSRIYLLAPDGTYYDLPYRDLYQPAISLYERRSALKRLREQGHRAFDESALFSAVDSMRRITEHASKQTKLARRQRERQRHWQRATRTTVSTDVVKSPVLPTVQRGEGMFASVEEWI
jgi:putative transposase